MTAPWPTVTLSEVLTHYRDYIDRPEPTIYPKLSVKLYGKGVVLDAPSDGSQLKMQRHQLAKPGQVILSEIWGKKGAIGFVPEEGAGALCTSHFFLFDVNERKVLRGWLQAIFEANFLANQLGSQAFGTTGYAAVRPKNLLACTIPLPPLAEQHRIVAKIEALAAKVEEAKRLHQSSTLTTQSLFRQAYAALFTNQNWPEFTLDKLVGKANLRNGKSLKPGPGDTGVSCLRLSAMHQGQLDLSDAKPTPLSPEQARPYLVRKNCAYVMRGNGSKHLVGRAAIATSDSDSVIVPDLFIIVPLSDIPIFPEFFVAVWNSPQMRITIEDTAKTTSGIWKINQGHIASSTIPLPPRDQQLHVVHRLAEISEQAKSLQQLHSRILAELAALLPAILDKAFKGEL